MASRSGTKSRRPAVPPVETTPSVSNESFRVMGTPCRGPRSSPREIAASASRASFEGTVGAEADDGVEARIDFF